MTTTAAPRPSRAMNITLWLIQVLLAALFAMTGLTKLATPMAQLAAQLPWVADVPALLVRFVGIAELAASLGLLLPGLFRVRPALTPLAALGLVAVMLLAAVFHLSRGEAMVLPINLFVAALAGFVAWGRARKVPLRPR